jgi:hypothetical protein
MAGLRFGRFASISVLDQRGQLIWSLQSEESLAIFFSAAGAGDDEEALLHELGDVALECFAGVMTPP